MKNEPQEPLEQFIDDALKRLPDLKAPPELLGKVMSRIELQPVAWWQSGWVCWPLAIQIMVVAAFAVLAMLCFHGIADLWSSQLTTLLVARTGEWIRDAADLFRAVNVLTRPLKPFLLLHLIILCLIAPLVIGGIRTMWALTLNKEKQYES